ncbi:hypothetical protein BFL40_29620 [Pseudomonas costantinii]|uniref:Uncharacterized protein n=1 Tax=Pseudomonas costantinii TaxID=168469 RepID=A0A1S2UFD5_9PSED|nr:hypothetical protein BFL40_29620 [Pseudomonas costantinii]
MHVVDAWIASFFQLALRGAARVIERLLSFEVQFTWSSFCLWGRCWLGQLIDGITKTLKQRSLWQFIS